MTEQGTCRIVLKLGMDEDLDLVSLGNALSLLRHLLLRLMYIDAYSVVEQGEDDGGLRNTRARQGRRARPKNARARLLSDEDAEYRVISLSYNSPFEIVLGSPQAWVAEGILILRLLPTIVRRFSRMRVGLEQDRAQRELIQHYRRAVSKTLHVPESEIPGARGDQLAADALEGIARVIFESEFEFNDSDMPEDPQSLTAGEPE